MDARGRSTTPNSGGPILMVLAEEVSWQASHLDEVALPAAASALGSTVPQSGRASSTGAAEPPVGFSTTPSTT